MSKTCCDLRAFSWGKLSWTEMICVKNWHFASRWTLMIKIADDNDDNNIVRRSTWFGENPNCTHIQPAHYPDQKKHKKGKMSAWHQYFLTIFLLVKSISALSKKQSASIFLLVVVVQTPTYPPPPLLSLPHVASKHVRRWWLSPPIPLTSILQPLFMRIISK